MEKNCFIQFVVNLVSHNEPAVDFGVWLCQIPSVGEAAGFSRFITGPSAVRYSALEQKFIFK